MVPDSIRILFIGGPSGTCCDSNAFEWPGNLLRDNNVLDREQPVGSPVLLR